MGTTAISFATLAAGNKEPLAPLLSVCGRRELFFGAVSRRSCSGSGLSIAHVEAKSGPLVCKVGYAGVVDPAVVVDAGELDIGRLGIDGGMVAALAQRGIRELFPIQKAVLEPAMQGRDMIGRARTGTGKTLAFGLPILDKIIQFNAQNGRRKIPLALVLAPTRELACQVEKEFRLTAPRLSTTCCYGGTSIDNQLRVLRNGVDVVVGTPGRIIDLLERGALNLSQVQFAVLDEADQMLAVGFEEAIEQILQQLPKQRQTMMFSATMPPSIRSLTRRYLKNPLTIDLVGDSDQKLAEGISMFSVVSNSMEKASILGPLLTEHAKGGKSIVFTRTKRDANDLAHAMSTKYQCKALHGDISQAQRERTLSGFRDGRFNVLVATDVASRGLDIPNVDLVVHYELPSTSEVFVHRSGRTGRAGKKGSTILMYTSRQARDLELIEREIGCRFTKLPKVVGDDDMLGAMSGGGRLSSNRGYGDREGGSLFGRSSSSSSGYGRSGGYGESRTGRSSSSSGGYGRSGGYGETRTGRSSSSGGSRFGRSSSSSGGYGRSGGSSSGRRSGYGGAGRSGSGRSRGGEFDGGPKKSSGSDFWDLDGFKSPSKDSDALGGSNGYW